MRKSILISCCAVFMVTASCRKFLDVGMPAAQIAAGTAFSNDKTAVSVMAGIYVMMADANFMQGNSSISVICGKAADEFGYPRQDNYFQNTALGDEFWAPLYKVIYNANNFMEQLEKAESPLLTAAIRKQLTAECKFLRAFCYFYLVNLYGPVPVVTNAKYFENAELPRSPVHEVYAQIIRDLKDAREDLKADFVGWNAVQVSAERTRPNKASASALLARAYLYDGQYKLAADEAISVIGNTAQFKLYGNLDSVFLMNSREAIWQLQPGDPGGPKANTRDGGAFVRNDWKYTSPVGNIWLGENILADFESDDLRRQHWTAQGVDTVADIYPFKYKQFQEGYPQSEYLMVLRLAEQYLIAAEALAEDNDTEAARTYLNAVRRRAGLDDVTTNDKDLLIAAIMKERRTELFSEWGHRWFDLKRTGTIDGVMEQAALKKGTVWQSYKALFALPLTDLQTNGKLVQNTGYPSPR